MLRFGSARRHRHIKVSIHVESDPEAPASSPGNGEIPASLQDLNNVQRLPLAVARIRQLPAAARARQRQRRSIYRASHRGGGGDRPAAYS
jgi:hypothetical protein